MKSNWFSTVSCTRDGFSFAVYVRVGDAWLESCEQFWWLRCDAREASFIDFSPNINWLVIFDFCINRNDLFDFIVSIERSNTIVISEWKWISLPLFVPPHFHFSMRVLNANYKWMAKKTHLFTDSVLLTRGRTEALVPSFRFVHHF